MTTDLLMRQDEATLWVTLNRPDCGNAFTMEMVEALTEALHRVPQDTKLVVLSGEGQDFCKGRDYREAPESSRGGRTPTALQIRDEMTTPILALYTAIKDLPVPTVSVVHGEAHGFGCALACACDIVLAAEGSRFRLPEMQRGLPPTLAMTALLDRMTLRGLSYLVYSTAEINALAALAAGLVSAVYPEGALDREAKALGEGICSQPLAAVRAVKDYLRLAPHMEPRGRAHFGAGLFAAVLSSR